MINVLIPTDFSKNSKNAIAYAIAFFKDTPCSFHLINVLDSNPEDTSNSEFLKRKSSLLKEQKKITDASKNNSHLAQSGILYGDLIAAIKNEVNVRKINLIIMAAQGLPKNSGSTIGSKTTEVISKVKCNVIIVPKKASFRPVNQIAFVSDYSVYFGTQILKTLSTIIEMFYSNIHIVHLIKSKDTIVQEQVQNKEQLKDYFIEEKHQFYTLLNKNPKAEIQKFIEKHQIKLLAIMAKNVHLYQQLIFQNNKTNLEYQSTTPLLILHE